MFARGREEVRHIYMCVYMYIHIYSYMYIYVYVLWAEETTRAVEESMFARVNPMSRSPCLLGCARR